MVLQGKMVVYIHLCDAVEDPSPLASVWDLWTMLNLYLNRANFSLQHAHIIDGVINAGVPEGLLWCIGNVKSPLFGV